MATNPAFASTPRLGSAQISTANTNRDGTGTLGSVLTAGASGSRIDRVRITATVTTTAGMVRLYVDDGTNVRLIREVVVSAITVAAATAGFTAEIEFDGGLLLPDSNHILKASTHNAETFNVFAIGGDF